MVALFNAPRTQANAASADAAVLAGAHYLDTSRQVSPHWREHIDITTLDMGSIRHDVYFHIGQTSESLGLTIEQAIGYGFEPAEDDTPFHAHLTKAWRRHLTAGRKTGTAA